MLKVVLVQYVHVVVNNAGNVQPDLSNTLTSGTRLSLIVQTDLIEPEPFEPVIPRKVLDKAIQLLASVSESRQVLARFDDNIRADPFSISKEHELVQATSSCFIVASRNDVLLLNGKR